MDYIWSRFFFVFYSTYIIKNFWSVFTPLSPHCVLCFSVVLEVLPAAAAVSWPTFLEPAALACAYLSTAHGTWISSEHGVVQSCFLAVLKESALLTNDGSQLTMPIGGFG